MQICSFLPSATEILYALGLGDSVAGVTFECDFPPEASGKVVVVNTNLDHALTSAEIEHNAREQIHSFVKKSIGPDPGCCQRLEIVLVGPRDGVLFPALDAKSVFPGEPRLDLLDK